MAVVFDRRDDDYYTFKESVESKEAIREVAGTDDADVINQLERWWDKYKVSLHELDSQVEEAESIMNGYLKELGYE